MVTEGFLGKKKFEIPKTKRCFGSCSRQIHLNSFNVTFGLDIPLHQLTSEFYVDKVFTTNSSKFFQCYLWESHTTTCQVFKKKNHKFSVETPKLSYLNKERVSVAPIMVMTSLLIRDNARILFVSIWSGGGNTAWKAEFDVAIKGKYFTNCCDQAETAFSVLNVEYSFLTKYAKNHTMLRRNMPARVLNPPPPPRVTVSKGNFPENKTDFVLSNNKKEISLAAPSNH